MKRSLLCAPMLLSVLAFGTLAYAQPDPNEAPKGVNPPVQMPGGGGDWQRLTPAQRRESLQQMTEQTLRMSMAFVGLEPTVQSAIIATVKEREKSLADVREKHRAVALGLMTKKDDAQMEIALDNLRFAQDDAAGARTKQLAELDKKIDFSHKPRLKAFLSIAGIIDDNSAAVGGVMSSLMGTLTNLGMGDTPLPKLECPPLNRKWPYQPNPLTRLLNPNNPKAATSSSGGLLLASAWGAMTPSKVCSRCGGSRLEPGQLKEQGYIHFRLDRAPFFSIFGSNVEVRAEMCLDCGAIELTGDVTRAREQLKIE